MLGFNKIVELDLAIRKQHPTRDVYHQALIAKLEAMLTESPPAAEAVSS